MDNNTAPARRFFFSEVPEPCFGHRAIPLQARTLAGAESEADNRRVFSTNAIVLGTKVDRSGCLVDCIAVREGNAPWLDFVDE